MSDTDNEGVSKDMPKNPNDVVDAIIVSADVHDSASQISDDSASQISDVDDTIIVPADLHDSASQTSDTSGNIVNPDLSKNKTVPSDIHCIKTARNIKTILLVDVAVQTEDSDKKSTKKEPTDEELDGTRNTDEKGVSTDVLYHLSKDPVQELLNRAGELTDERISLLMELISKHKSYEEAIHEMRKMQAMVVTLEQYLQQRSERKEDDKDEEDNASMKNLDDDVQKFRTTEQRSEREEDEKDEEDNASMKKLDNDAQKVCTTGIEQSSSSCVLESKILDRSDLSCERSGTSVTLHTEETNMNKNLVTNSTINERFQGSMQQKTSEKETNKVIEVSFENKDIENSHRYVVQAKEPPFSITFVVVKRDETVMDKPHQSLTIQEVSEEEEIENAHCHIEQTKEPSSSSVVYHSDEKNNDNGYTTTMIMDSMQQETSEKEKIMEEDKVEKTEEIEHSECHIKHTSESVGNASNDFFIYGKRGIREVSDVANQTKEEYVDMDVTEWYKFWYDTEPKPQRRPNECIIAHSLFRPEFSGGAPDTK